MPDGGILDFLFGRKALDKATKTGDPAPQQSISCPNCGTGITSDDVAKMAQVDADKAAKAKAATPAPAPKKTAPKKISSLGDMMQGDA